MFPDLAQHNLGALLDAGLVAMVNSLALALSCAATSDRASISLAITEEAPARIAASDDTPDPAAKSMTRLPRTVSG